MEAIQCTAWYPSGAVASDGSDVLPHHRCVRPIGHAGLHRYYGMQRDDVIAIHEFPDVAVMMYTTENVTGAEIVRLERERRGVL